MRAFKVISNPEAFQLMADETRRQIVYLLRVKERTVSQLAAELDRTPQAVYHHIRKLKEADMVEIAREVRVDHFIETYYRASAELFHFAHGEGSAPAADEARTREVLEALGKVGVKVRTDADTVKRIVELEKRIESAGRRPEFDEKVAVLADVDFLAKQGVYQYGKLLNMTNEEYEEFLKLLRELRKLLRAKLEEPVRA